MDPTPPASHASFDTASTSRNTSPTATSVATETPSPTSERLIKGQPFPLPADYDTKRPLYRPHGKWEWASGAQILSCEQGTKLGDGLEGTVYLKVGRIRGKEVVYISKLCSVWIYWELFFSSLYLNASSKYLRPLQGDCIPWIIGVTHCNGGYVGLAQDLPHPTGWREADMFLEEEQKEAVIAAYQKLHDRGVLHGDAEYRHWLIGDDNKVTIIDFGLSRPLDLDEGAEAVKIGRTSKQALEVEMRKVKYMLNYKDSQEMEQRLSQLRHERLERDRAKRELLEIVDGQESEPPREPLSEEEKAAPFLGLRPNQIREWHYGYRWTAHRFEVTRLKRRVKINKTPVPRPPIPSAEDDPYLSQFLPAPAPNPVVQPDTLEIDPQDSLPVPQADAVPTVSEDHTSGGDQIIAEPQGPTPGPSNWMDNPSGSRKRPREQLLDEFSSESDVPTEPEDNGEQRTWNVRRRGKDNEGEKIRGRHGPAMKRRRIGSSEKLQRKARPEQANDKFRLVPNTSFYYPRTEGDEDSVFWVDPRDAVHNPPRAKTSGPTGTKPLGWEGPRHPPRACFENKNQSGVLQMEATDQWNAFDNLRKTYLGLQQQLEQVQSQAELHRDSFLRAFLKMPALDRKPFLDSIGQHDSLSILEFQPVVPSQQPMRNPDPTAILREGRVQVGRMVANARVAPRNPPGPKKEYFRIPEIKRATRKEFVPRVPSKLGPSSGSLTKVPSPESASPTPGESSSAPEPSPEVQAALLKAEQYRIAVMRRAALELEREKAGITREGLVDVGHVGDETGIVPPTEYTPLPQLPEESSVDASPTPGLPGEEAISAQSHDSAGATSRAESGLPGDATSSSELAAENVKSSATEDGAVVIVSPQPDDDRMASKAGPEAMELTPAPVVKRKRDESDEVDGPVTKKNKTVTRRNKTGSRRK